MVVGSFPVCEGKAKGGEVLVETQHGIKETEIWRRVENKIIDFIIQAKSFQT